MFGDVRSYAMLAAAVAAGDAKAAERLARSMTRRVEERLLLAVDALHPGRRKLSR